MKSQQIQIRPTVLLDSPKILTGGAGFFLAGNNPLYKTFTQAEVDHHLHNEGKYCFVAETEEQKIVGFILAAKVFEEKPRFGHLEWAYCESLGVGVKLALAACRALFADGVTHSVTEVCTKNKRCANGVIKNGGVMIGSKHFYEDIEKMGSVVITDVVQTANLFLVSNNV